MIDNGIYIHDVKIENTIMIICAINSIIRIDVFHLSLEVYG